MWNLQRIGRVRTAAMFAVVAFALGCSPGDDDTAKDDNSNDTTHSTTTTTAPPGSCGSLFVVGTSMTPRPENVADTCAGTTAGTLTICPNGVTILVNEWGWGIVGEPFQNKAPSAQLASQCPELEATIAAHVKK